MFFLLFLFGRCGSEVSNPRPVQRPNMETSRAFGFGSLCGRIGDPTQRPGALTVPTPAPEGPRASTPPPTQHHPIPIPPPTPASDSGPGLRERPQGEFFWACGSDTSNPKPVQHPTTDSSCTFSLGSPFGPIGDPTQRPGALAGPTPAPENPRAPTLPPTLQYPIPAPPPTPTPASDSGPGLRERFQLVFHLGNVCYTIVIFT